MYVLLDQTNLGAVNQYLMKRYVLSVAASVQFTCKRFIDSNVINQSFFGLKT